MLKLNDDQKKLVIEILDIQTSILLQQRTENKRKRIIKRLEKLGFSDPFPFYE